MEYVIRLGTDSSIPRTPTVNTYRDQNDRIEQARPIADNTRFLFTFNLLLTKANRYNLGYLVKCEFEFDAAIILDIHLTLIVHKLYGRRHYTLTEHAKYQLNDKHKLHHHHRSAPSFHEITHTHNTAVYTTKNMTHTLSLALALLLL